MAAPGLLGEYLTEFDDRIGSELNLDPLGLQAIWSAYGQAIFRSRISSISNDVRNYTLNLFNHRLAKALVEDDTLAVGRGLNRQTYGGKKDSLAFKQACLIHLENVFTFVMVEAEAKGRADVQATGVLGIGNARRLWNDKGSAVRLVFSHREVAYVLARQTSLGVSGRYKTPLVQMKFFDSAYDYSLPSAARLWREADDQLFGPLRPLAKLQALALSYMKELLTGAEREPTRRLGEVPVKLKQAFVEAFKSPAAVGSYAREFWLAVTGLDQGGSGALYRVLEREFQANPKEPWSASTVFGKAFGQTALAAPDKAKLRYVVQLEPFLAELDLLLRTMLSEKAQSLDEVAVKWAELRRTDGTLGDLAAAVERDPALIKQVAGTPSDRLGRLLQLAREPGLKRQACKLLEYHNAIMETRGQSPWLRLARGNQLKIDVRKRDLPDADSQPVGAWIHHYYIPQFRQLLSGLRGAA